MELETSPRLTKESAEENQVLNPLVGNSPKMRQVHALINKIAGSNSTILITGASGTGKELAARAIHELSPRREQPFVPVNCAAIPEELLESELFGHVRGAFTGAVNSRQGRFQIANGGTLFLDEIGEMSPKLQVKLLRVLQERQFEPVGSDRAVQVDVRVVAATNRDLHVAVREGKFREDLFYRLNVLPVQLPALREREGDVPVLVNHFLALHALRKAKRVALVESDAMAMLEKYRWPGNVREVENLVERLIVLNDDGVIRASELPDYVIQNGSSEQTASAALPASGMDLDHYLERIENGFICQALERARGNKTLAAGMLNLNRTTFIERLRKKGLLNTSRQNPNSGVVNVTDERHLGTSAEGSFWNPNGFSNPNPGKFSTVTV
ncbi:MAG: sigma 54-interacting transcriptional regulator [Deltaproteobacteria bacterium]|nr:sigma 54-interacting transcriptional regulator [Deltaproteobacteria bacterium]